MWPRQLLLFKIYEGLLYGQVFWVILGIQLSIFFYSGMSILICVLSTLYPYLFFAFKICPEKSTLKYPTIFISDSFWHIIRDNVVCSLRNFRWINARPRVYCNPRCLTKADVNFWASIASAQALKNSHV